MEPPPKRSRIHYSADAKAFLLEAVVKFQWLRANKYATQSAFIRDLLALIAKYSDLCPVHPAHRNEEALKNYYTKTLNQAGWDFFSFTPPAQMVETFTTGPDQYINLDTGSPISSAFLID